MTNFEELVTKARKGDAGAQQALYKATVQSVYYTIANLINDRTQAEDLTQDVYVAVLKNLDRLSQPAGFPRWVNRIAANTARNYLKKHKPVLFTTDEQEEEAIGNLPAVGEDFLPEEYALQQELRAELMAAVRSLPEKQRIAIFLHYFEGMTVAELSKALEVGENTVKSRLNAGRNNIGKKLTKAGVAGSTATVLGLAFRNDCLSSFVPAGTRAGMWLAIEAELAAAGAVAGAAAGAGAATGAVAAAGTAAGAGMAAAAVKTGFFSALWVKIVAIVLAAAVVVGGVVGCVHLFGNDKDDISINTTTPADTASDADNKDKNDKNATTVTQDNPYGLPEEMLSFAPWFEDDDPEDDQLKDLLLRDFGEMVDVFEFEDGTRLEYYHDGYAKLYISAEMIARTECGNEPRLDVILNDLDGDLVIRTGYYGSNMTSKSGDVLNHICGVDETGNAVYYFTPLDVRTNREPSSMTFMVRENEDILYMVERETTGLSGKANNPFYPPEPEDTAAPLPALDTFYLDLAAMPYDTTVGWFGTPEFDWGWQVYVYPTGDVCLAFAYGEAAGVNYVMTNLDRLLPDMTEPLTLEQMMEIFPGGVEEFDFMDERQCFFWWYENGCPLFIYPEDDGLYYPDSLVEYNCADIVIDKMPTEPTVRESMYDLIGMSKADLDRYFGLSGEYDTNGIICSYSYETMNGSVICYMEGMNTDRCISVMCEAPVLIENISGDLYVSDLKDMFGNYYEDWSAGFGFYRTVLYDSEISFHMDGAIFSKDCWVSITKLGSAELLNATAAMDQWWNGNDMRDLTMTPALDMPFRTSTELHLHSIVYGQITSPFLSAEVGNLTLYSTDGITYKASGVADNWGNVYDLTITFKAHAAYIDWAITQAGANSNFSFDNWIAYYMY